jgi:hypothetical protein
VRRNDAPLQLDRLQPMIRIAITGAAYAAIRESLPPAKSRRDAPHKTMGNLYLVCVPNDTMDKLSALRRPGESFSEVIIRLASMET